MAHSDNNGLVLPPKLAPIHVVMVPIFKTDEERTKVLASMSDMKVELERCGYTVKIDDRDNLRSGFKFAEWELKGVPVRVAMGPRDMENSTVEVARRDTREKSVIARNDVVAYISSLMDDIQDNIYAKAVKFREDNTTKVDDWASFKERIEGGGFILAHWDGTAETEEKIKEETKATIRCIPLDAGQEEGICVYSGKPSKMRVIFARAY